MSNKYSVMIGDGQIGEIESTEIETKPEVIKADSLEIGTRHEYDVERIIFNGIEYVKKQEEE